MEINTLRFAAVGPYPDEAFIDFDALGAHALFSIDGPTGSGKSTIIDAIAFALYADVAGGTESDKSRMRSAYARPQQESFVELVFTTSAGRYRIHRQPEYLRPKARGDGLTKQAAKSELWRETGAGQWEPVATSNVEVGTEVKRIVGLDKDQFLQTVVLPQGKFATFLRADSKVRQEILETIFATSIYSRVQDVLQAERKAADEAIDAATHALDTAASRLVGRIHGTTYLDAAADDAASGLDEAGLDQLVVRIGTDVTAATAAVEHAQAALVAAEQSIARIDAAEQTSARAEQAERELAKAAAAEQAARDDLGAHAFVLDGIDIADPAAAARALHEARGALEALADVATALARRRREAKSIATERSGADKRRSAARQQATVTVPAAILAAAVRLAGESTDAQVQAKDASTRHAALVQARIDGIAGELAGGLLPTQPCPVCGSPDHPAPAAPAEVQVDADDIDAAQRVATHAHQASASVQAEHRRADAEVARIRSDGVDVDALAAAFAGADAVDAVADLADLVVALDEARTAVAELTVRIESLDQQAEALAVQIGADEERLAAHAAPFASIAERTTALDQVIDALDLVVQAAALVRERAAIAKTARAEQAKTAKALQGLDVDAERARIETVKVAAANAHAHARDLTRLREAVGELTVSIQRARADLVVVQAQAAPVRRMADAVAGRLPNTMKQELRAYVLQQMFDEVLVAANARLRGMLDGNFMLVEEEDARGRERKAGLGLAVRDLRTDSIRSAESLSGGETFCASLSLALGLADTVRAHAGGIDIDMLIVDEGFGSLDPERLDDVLNELNALRAQGRTVGVISHVEDMKKAINDAIHVRPRGDGQGSSIEVTWMP